MSGEERVAVELTVHLGAVLLTGNDGTMRPLKHLALDPAKMQVPAQPTPHPISCGFITSTDEVVCCLSVVIVTNNASFAQKTLSYIKQMTQNI